VLALAPGAAPAACSNSARLSAPSLLASVLEMIWPETAETEGWRVCREIS
jgi:hypothetical protein